MERLYPLKFKPILKEKIWGGEKLNKNLGKPKNGANIGESWEISNVDDNVSIVANGKLMGKKLNDVIDCYKHLIMGQKVYDLFKNEFPLLIKFIDAKEDLSIQLHPNDQLAKSRHNSFGKTEMWYVMQADEDAELIVGFKSKISKQEYLDHLNNNTLPTILNSDKVNKGDTYFIEVGRVHAIGAGVLLAEIQQTSDITYRLYDWDRQDKDGNLRELHTELALDAIDFNMKDNFKVAYSKDLNKPNHMVACSYFNTNFINVTDHLNVYNDNDSFHIYICVEGKLKLDYGYGTINLEHGETLLMPASIKEFNIVAENAKLLQVYI